MAPALFALVAGILTGAVIGWHACCTFVGKNWDAVAAKVEQGRGVGIPAGHKGD